MSLHFPDNQYPGVNAHLMNQLLQPDGAWESFHAEWIIQLRVTLDAALPQNYYAIAEKSLQIGQVGDETLQRSRPDVSLYRVGSDTGLQPEGSSAATAPTTTMALSEVTAEYEDDLMSVGIYEISDGQVPGTLITRLEILSPGNKPPASYAIPYRRRRLETLKAGVNLVEIDLIHTWRPIIERLPSYVDRHERATPSLVLVSRPLPDIDDGQFRVYQVAIGQALPRLAVPLSLSVDVEPIVDVQETYNRTYANTRIFPLLVDYARDPVAFNSYHEADQEWIRQFLHELRQSNSS